MIYFQTQKHQTLENNEGLAAVFSLILHNKSTKAETENKGFTPKHR